VSSWIVGVLRRGYKLSFWERPPLTRKPFSYPTSRYKVPILQQEILTLLEKEAIEEVLDISSPGFYSRLFVVPKPNSKWRPIIDLKALNQYLKIPKFSMENLQSIWASLIPGNFTFSLDLQDAYFHIPVHPDSRKFLRFTFGGRVYQFRALPFGLSTAPWIFTKVVSEVKVLAHLQGIQLYLYLDDWLVQIANFLQGLNQAKYLTDLCTELGLVLNMEKSELCPSQNFDFIGANFQLHLNLVLPKGENAQKAISKIQSFLRSDSPTAKEWQSMLGTLTSQFRFVPFGQLHLRPIQWFLQDNWDQTKGDPWDRIRISQEIKMCLLWWMKQLSNPVGVPLVPPSVTVHIFTDASERGWGAHVAGATYQGTWSTEESKLHINILELRAVRLALLAHRPPCHNSILVATDNTTVKSYINRQGGTRSRSLMKETVLLFSLVMQSQWLLKARHIAGKNNVLADQLSRAGQVIATEWSLNQEVVEGIFQQWGKPLVDLCATSLNNKCPLYVSPVPDPQALTVDALSVDFQGLDAYVYPPQQLLSRILQKFQLVQHCRLIVVAPWWPHQPWFPVLNQLSVSPPLQLPQIRSLLRQPRSATFHPNLATLNLHAWRLEK